MKDVIIIGGGIIGSTIAKYLHKNYVDVLLIDDKNPDSASKASGSHIKPSWIPGLDSIEIAQSLEVLDKCWGLITENYRNYKGKSSTEYTDDCLHRVDTDLVLSDEDTPKFNGHVMDVNISLRYPKLICTDLLTLDKVEYRTRNLVVCAGYWSAQLLPEFIIKMTAKKGVSFRMKGKIEAPFIKQWAPYKQVVAHQQARDSIWLGDGSTIKPENWKVNQDTTCLSRCLDLFPEQRSGVIQETITGWRPYCSISNPKHPCLFQKEGFGLNTTIVTGSGKNGTISAGWASGLILKSLV